MDTGNQFLGTERIGKLMRQYAIPCIISLLVGALYNIIDQIFIANASYLGSYGNAANTVVFPLTVVALAIAVMIGDGCCAFVSMALGRNEVDKARRSVGNAVVLSIAGSFALTAIYLVFADRIIAMFGGTVNEETFRHAQEYFFYITLGIPFYMFGQAMNPVIRADGSPRFAMVSTLAGAVINIILDPIFIHFIGFHGAAIATLLSQVICLAFMLIYLKKKKLFEFKISAFDKNDVLPLIQKAIPSVIQQSIPAISTTFLTALVSTYSVTAIAAYGVTGKLETILFYPAMALNMVLTTIIGQCVGGARYDRTKDYLKCALGYGCGLLVILSVLVVGFSKQLSGLFVKSDAVAAIVGTYFLIVSVGYILNTVTNCYLGALNGMGKPSKSMFLMIFYYIVVRMPLAYLLSYLGFGLNGIWVAVLVSHVVASVAAGISGTIAIKKRTSTT